MRTLDRVDFDRESSSRSDRRTPLLRHEGGSQGEGARCLICQSRFLITVDGQGTEECPQPGMDCEGSPFAILLRRPIREHRFPSPVGLCLPSACVSSLGFPLARRFRTFLSTTSPHRPSLFNLGSDIRRTVSSMDWNSRSRRVALQSFGRNFIFRENPNEN